MAVLTLLSASACYFPTGCDAYAAPGLSITARDATTGASIQGNDVRVILSAERQADTTRSLPASLAYESPGTSTRWCWRCRATCAGNVRESGSAPTIVT